MPKKWLSNPIVPKIPQGRHNLPKYLENFQCGLIIAIVPPLVPPRPALCVVRCAPCSTRFFHRSEQVTSVTQKKEGTRQTAQTGQTGVLPLLGGACTARSASAASKARTNSSSRQHCRTRSVGEPLDGVATAASHHSRPRRLSPVLAMPPLSSKLRARAWPLYLRCLSCSGDLAPSVPPRAIAVAFFPSTVRTSIIQRSRPPGFDNDVHAGVFHCSVVSLLV